MMHRAPGGRITKLVLAAVIGGFFVGGVLAALVWAIVGLAT